MKIKEKVMSEGEKIKALRKAKGWTQIELAEKAGISPITLCRLEYGKHKANLSTLTVLAKALKVKLQELVG